MEQYKKECIEFMVDSKVLKFGDFTLKSGRKSPFFMNAGGYAGKEVIMGIRPEHVKAAGADAAFTLDATVNVFELLGAEVYLYVDIAGEAITVRESSEIKARVDDKLALTLDVAKIHVFDKETEQIITN